MSSRIPWYLWLAAFGVTSAMIGVHWDISWHRSIGRDTFWTPPHLAIQLCGIIAAIACGFLILGTTFTRSPLRDSSVSVFGFRGPLGAFVMAWGGFAMISSAPFDDWWHSAYGLDVKILSPPHVVLAMGMYGVEIGALILIAAQMNRASGSARRPFQYMFLYMAAMLMIGGMILVLEFTPRILLHSAIAYRVVSMIAPITLLVSARATRMRWAATTVAGIYTAFLLGLVWILPLFPAQPKLGPVMHPVTQFVPNGFPLLLIVPAILIDLVMPRLAGWPNWRQALVAGPLFLLSFLAVEWPFGTFLQSPAAHDAIFGSGYLDYSAGPRSLYVLNVFMRYEKTPGEFATGMLIAAICAILASWLGMARGDWLKSVRR
jgi:hypothetical protein